METPSPYLDEATPSQSALGRGARPVGVTILSILAFLGTAAFTLGALAMFALGGFLGSFAGSEGALFGAILGGFFSIFLLITAALMGLMGFGHWTGAGWAWVLQLVLSGLSILSGLWSIVEGDFSAVLGLAISGFIIWYMLQPGVKRWYGRS